jgi:hypothetical protein
VSAISRTFLSSGLGRILEWLFIRVKYTFGVGGIGFATRYAALLPGFCSYEIEVARLTFLVVDLVLGGMESLVEF